MCGDEADGVCGVDGTEGKCIQAFGINTWKKEIQREIWTKMWGNDVLKGIWKEYDGKCVDYMHKKNCDPWSWLFNDNYLVINYSVQIHRNVTNDVLKGIIPKIIRKDWKTKHHIWLRVIGKMKNIGPQISTLFQ
jgi:hypothetical protein